MDEQARFWQHVHKDCWVWQSSLTSDGYGRFYTHGGRETGKTVLAHRYAYEKVYGAIPDGVSVLHRCDNPACVRPDHLFLGTHQDNMADMKLKQRARPGLTKLTAEDVIMIRKRAANGDRPKDIAADYNIAACNVSNIIARRAWPNV